MIYFSDPTPCDIDADGIVDAYAGFADTDGDGQYDAQAIFYDTNNDGVIDTTLIDNGYEGVVMNDTDGNGVPDTFISWVDDNADGNPELLVKSYDYDQDGNIDMSRTHIDVDGDGNYEVVQKQFSTDHGFTTETYYSDSGSGSPDAAEKVEYVDTNNDGMVDTAHYQADTNGDGNFDVQEMYLVDSQTGELVPQNGGINYSSGMLGDVEARQLDNFTPGPNYPEGIVGDPAASLENWEYQEYSGPCALFSQIFVIEDLTGREVSVEEVLSLADENGWYDIDTNSGTTALNMNKVLEYYGVENEMSFNNDIDSLEQALKDGGKVIVSVDGDQIWFNENPDIFAPDSASNHAVEVIGIDYTDPNNPMVILNDSGSPNGRGEMVPLEVFDSAWETGDRQMVVAYA